MCEFHKKIGQILKCVVVITADFSGEICKKKIRRKFDCCKYIYYIKNSQAYFKYIFYIDEIILKN